MEEKASNSIVTIENLSHQFGSKTVLTDIQLDICKGEFVTILGPSGCGKTTLMRLIGGFLKASEGKITIAGKDMTYTPPHLQAGEYRFSEICTFPSPECV